VIFVVNVYSGLARQGIADVTGEKTALAVTGGKLLVPRGCDDKDTLPLGREIKQPLTEHGGETAGMATVEYYNQLGGADSRQRLSQLPGGQAVFHLGLPVWHLGQLSVIRKHVPRLAIRHRTVAAFLLIAVTSKEEDDLFVFAGLFRH
jgi:hypothetical protein